METALNYSMAWYTEIPGETKGVYSGQASLMRYEPKFRSLMLFFKEDPCTFSLYPLQVFQVASRFLGSQPQYRQMIWSFWRDQPTFQIPIIPIGRMMLPIQLFMQTVNLLLHRYVNMFATSSVMVQAQQQKLIFGVYLY